MSPELAAAIGAVTQVFGAGLIAGIGFVVLILVTRSEGR